MPAPDESGAPSAARGRSRRPAFGAPWRIAHFTLVFVRLCVLAAIGLCLTSAAVAQSKPHYLAGVAYEEVVRGGEEGDALPLLVAFHYSGGSSREAFENYDQISGPVRILVPLGRYPKRQGLSYFPTDYYQRTPEAQFRVARETTADMARFLAAAEARYRRRPVVSGISQGGDISLLLAIYHPETVAAAIPLAAVIPEALAAPPADPRRNSPCILLMQGEDDPIVDVSLTRARAQALGATLPLALVTYPGLGHDISPAMKADYTSFIEGALRRAGSTARRAAACSFPRRLYSGAQPVTPRREIRPGADR